MATKKEYKIIHDMPCINIKSLAEHYDLNIEDLYYNEESGCIVDKDGNIWADNL